MVTCCRTEWSPTGVVRMNTNNLMYLRQDVQMEPLVDQWYAWSHLIPPATTARNMTQRHFKIMESYLNAPQVHASAVRNPAMLGGPFIDHGGRRVDEIRKLRDHTKHVRANLVELSSALEQLDEMLRIVPDGHSLQPLYERVPTCLRGLVELVYDTRHNANFRLIEPLLYESDLYDVRRQSLMLSITSGDNRPFVLSTPRLEETDALHVMWPFSDGRIDYLFQLKTRPLPWSAIMETCGIQSADEPLFRRFFTDEPRRPYERYVGAGVRWRYFGHACILIETKDVSVLFDPVLSYTYESDIARYTYADLPDRIDYVFVTHNHQDHILFETLLQIRHKVGEIIVPKGGTGFIQDPSLRLALKYAGFGAVRELGDMETLEIPGGAVTGIPFLGEHCDLFVSTKQAYLVRFGREQLLFAADSCNLDAMLYQRIMRIVGPVGTLFLGMECVGAPMTWLYGPLLLRTVERGLDQSRRLNGSDYSQAARLIEACGCKNVFVYAMGQEPWLNYVMNIRYTEQSKPIVDSDRVIRECRERGMTSERLFGEREILLNESCDGVSV
jgi:L-ascorbate metabolism protein UlaG (beta-lactamase superfamily)